VTSILLAATNHQWGMKKTPTDGSFTLSPYLTYYLIPDGFLVEFPLLLIAFVRWQEKDSPSKEYI